MLHRLEKSDFLQNLKKTIKEEVMKKIGDYGLKGIDLDKVIDLTQKETKQRILGMLKDRIENLKDTIKTIERERKKLTDKTVRKVYLIWIWEEEKALEELEQLIKEIKEIK